MSKPAESPLAKHLGIEIVAIEEGHARARLVIRDHHKTPTGVVHSGTIISLADNTATLAANRANRSDAKSPDVFMILVDLHANMLDNRADGALVAEADILRSGRRITVVRTRVFAEDGGDIALVTTTHIPAQVSA